MDAMGADISVGGDGLSFFIHIFRQTDWFPWPRPYNCTSSLHLRPVVYLDVILQAQLNGAANIFYSPITLRSLRRTKHSPAKTTRRDGAPPQVGLSVGQFPHSTADALAKPELTRLNTSRSRHKHK